MIPGPWTFNLDPESHKMFPAITTTDPYLLTL
jgi:hypothetical protein